MREARQFAARFPTASPSLRQVTRVPAVKAPLRPPGSSIAVSTEGDDLRALEPEIARLVELYRKAAGWWSSELRPPRGPRCD